MALVALVGNDRHPSEARAVEDPFLRQAVLDLFQANRAFTEAYRDGRAVDEAARRIDDARERVWSAQTLTDRRG